MDMLSTLLSQYSIENIILVVTMLGVAIKFVGDLIEYFYNKLRKYFNYQNEKDKTHSEITDGLSDLKNEISDLRRDFCDVKKELEGLKAKSELTTDRLQENTKCYIMDRHHYFCYEVKAIDDLNLQSLERRYLYYKSSGGDTYIDGLMEELRSLPRLNLQNEKVVNAIHNVI